jgi:putative transposase
MIFASDEVKELFLLVLRRAKRRYRFQIENFCIMGNHFHLILRPHEGENLSAIMQWILSVFAMAYNRARSETGHVWGARFFSRIIASLAAYLHISTYIDTNPLRANLVDRPQDWPYGGLWHLLSGCRELIATGEAGPSLFFPGREPLA